MDEHTFKSGIQILSVVLGVIIPIVIVLFNRVIADHEKKVDKLFSLCDETKACLMEKAVQIGKLETEIEGIKNEINRILDK